MPVIQALPKERSDPLTEKNKTLTPPRKPDIKLLAFPFVLVTGVLYLVCRFLVVASGAVLGILSRIVFLRKSLSDARREDWRAAGQGG